MDQREVKKAINSSLNEIHSDNLALLQCLLDEIKKLNSRILEVKLGEKISYSLKEAAPLTGLSYETLYNNFKSGRLPGSQVAGRGGAILVLRADLVNFISSRRDDTFAFTVGQISQTKPKHKPHGTYTNKHR